MPELESNALTWKAVLLPLREPMQGRTVTLEPLDPGRHADALWQAVQGHNEVWAWLFDGPYASQADFTLDIAKKQAASESIFYAIVPAATGTAAGTPALCAWTLHMESSKSATSCSPLPCSAPLPPRKPCS